MLTGYVKAYKPELKIKDYELYRGVYCSICKTLGKKYTLLSQLLLSYDFTFLTLFRLALEDSCEPFSKGRCCYNPAKKCLRCNSNNELERSADAVIITAYYKLKDNIADSGFFKKCLYRLMMPAAKLMHRKAALRQPFLDRAVSGAMAEQAKIENGGSVSPDAAADPSAKALAAVFSQGYYGEDKQELWRFGYMLGRWIYLADAADDLEADIKSGGFNPFKEKFQTVEAARSEEFYHYAEGILNMTAGEAAQIADLLEFKRFGDIIENVLYDGLFSVQNEILSKARCEENERPI